MSWADVCEQYDCLFNPQNPDREAQLMGVPPPPEWITPPKTAKRTLQEPEVPMLAHTNRFAQLAACSQSSPAPCTSAQDCGRSQAGTPRRSTSHEEVERSRTPSPHRNSEPTASPSSAGRTPSSTD